MKLSGLLARLGVVAIPTAVVVLAGHRHRAADRPAWAGTPSLTPAPAPAIGVEPLPATAMAGNGRGQAQRRHRVGDRPRVRPAGDVSAAIT